MTQAIRQLSIWLIKPSKYDDEGYVIRYWRGVLPSNTLTCLYGLTEDVRERGALGRGLRWRVELIDETVQKVDVKRILRESRGRSARTVVCLVGVQTNQFARASDLALEFRAGGADVLIGGFHVSGSLAMLPRTPPEIQRLLDRGVTVVAGEVEGRWEGILRDALGGTLKPLYNFLAEPPELGQAPAPRIHGRYLRRFVAPNFGTLDCGRGCPFSCSFCTVINVQGRTMRFRDPDRVAALIRRNYRRHRISYYFFTDDNFCRNRNWEALFDTLIRLRAEEGIPIRFMMQADTQSHKLPGFVEKAKEAGCSQVFIGLESLNERNLLAAGKRQNLAADFRRMVAAYRQAGINTHVAYIIGFPFDTLESVRADVERLKSELGPEQASFFMLTPLPGSQDHRELLRRGEALDPDLNRYDTFHATVRHPRMSRGEWEQAYREAWSSFYGMENMKAVLQRAHPRNYWGIFSNFIWYKNAVEVEGGHPMLSGFFRLRDRIQCRPGYPILTRRQHLQRSVRDWIHCARLWTRLALEMEELWLQTRPRSALEERIVEVLRRRNLLSNSLTFSRRPLRRFWRETWSELKAGNLHRVDAGKGFFNLAQEGGLFTAFLCAYLGHLFPHFLGRVAELKE